MTITIDGRTFTPTVLRVTVSTDCNVEGAVNSYFDYFFEEDGKEHLVREKAILVKEGDEEKYIKDENAPAEWYIKE